MIMLHILDNLCTAFLYLTNDYQTKYIQFQNIKLSNEYIYDDIYIDNAGSKHIVRILFLTVSFINEFNDIFGLQNL